MIDAARGNLVEADTEALVNTVNCVGYMGTVLSGHILNNSNWL